MNKQVTSIREQAGDMLAEVKIQQIANCILFGDLILRTERIRERVMI